MTKKIDHDKWLLKRGLHPTQLRKVRSRVKQNLKKQFLDSYRENMVPDLSGYVSGGMKGSPNATADRSLMKNLHREPEHVRKQILEKASRTMPLYNKGPLQLLTDGEDRTRLGTQSRR